MHFSNIDPEGWLQFDELARTEGWLISNIERELFQTDLKPHAWQLTHEDQCCGFVTAVPYQSTGWIGNLMVPPELRGLGYGSTLFDFAVEQLEANGIFSVWLTASEDGAPLYQSRGFRQIDVVQRLTLVAENRDTIQREHVLEISANLAEIDALNWQDDRSCLIQSLETKGEIFAVGESVAVLQPCGEFQMIGPWYIGSTHEQYLLLEHLLSRSVGTKGIVLDVISKSALTPFLLDHGFVETGSTKLMVKGEDCPSPKLAGFASLGSIG